MYGAFIARALLAPPPPGLLPVPLQGLVTVAGWLGAFPLCYGSAACSRLTRRWCWCRLARQLRGVRGGRGDHGPDRRSTAAAPAQPVRVRMPAARGIVVAQCCIAHADCECGRTEGRRCPQTSPCRTIWRTALSASVSTRCRRACWPPRARPMWASPTSTTCARPCLWVGCTRPLPHAPRPTSTYA
jgi:hypothetical protein